VLEGTAYGGYCNSKGAALYAAYFHRQGLGHTGRNPVWSAGWGKPWRRPHSGL